MNEVTLYPLTPRYYVFKLKRNYVFKLKMVCIQIKSVSDLKAYRGMANVLLSNSEFSVFKLKTCPVLRRTGEWRSPRTCSTHAASSTSPT